MSAAALASAAASAASASQLGDPAHWVVAMFLYLTVVDANRRRAAGSRLRGTLLYEVVCLTVMGFGGGILNPILLQHDAFFPFPMASDVVLPTILAAYLFTGLVGAARLEAPGVRHLRLVAFELVRAKLISGWCVKAAQIIPGSYFPQMPVFGVLVAGAVGGCGGLFLMSGGLSPVQESVPWPVESAIAASVVHFLVANAFVALPPGAAAALDGAGVNHAHLCVAGVLVVTRLVPAVRAALPWRLVPFPGGEVAAPPLPPRTEAKKASKKKD
jgi:hypothetical protein